MFNYLFPIFCFGLVITGIVFLGIIEAAKQAKVASVQERGPASGEDLSTTVSSRNGQPKGQSPRFITRAVNE